MLVSVQTATSIHITDKEGAHISESHLLRRYELHELSDVRLVALV